MFNFDNKLGISLYLHSFLFYVLISAEVLVYMFANFCFTSKL